MGICLIEKKQDFSCESAALGLPAKFSMIRDPEEAYKLASSVQDGLMHDEFIAEMKRLYEAQLKELSDDDVAMVAAGSSEVAQSIVGTVTVAAVTDATGAFFYDKR